MGEPATVCLWPVAKIVPSLHTRITQTRTTICRRGKRSHMHGHSLTFARLYSLNIQSTNRCARSWITSKILTPQHERSRESDRDPGIFRRVCAVVGIRHAPKGNVSVTVGIGWTANGPASRRSPFLCRCAVLVLSLVTSGSISIALCL